MYTLGKNIFMSHAVFLIYRLFFSFEIKKDDAAAGITPFTFRSGETHTCLVINLRINYREVSNDCFSVLLLGQSVNKRTTAVR